MSMIELFTIKTWTDLEDLSGKIMAMNIHYSQKRHCIERATQHWLNICRQ